MLPSKAFEAPQKLFGAILSWLAAGTAGVRRGTQKLPQIELEKI